jgi:hypothetical protein
VTKISSAATLVAAMLLCGAVAANCGSSKRSGRPSGPDGMLSMALSLPSGTTITSVQYTIHSNQATSPPADKSGTIDTSDDSATPSVETSYPVSSNDIVTLTALTALSEPCTGTSSEFMVVPNGQALVAVTLTCGLLTADQLHPDASAGSVRVNGTTVDNSDICPVLNAWSVSPLTTGPTGTIDVSALASDQITTDVLTYKWTASPPIMVDGGTIDPFTSSTSPSTTFNCPGTGNFALTITVDDHHTPQNCTASRTVNIACGLCGNGVVDPGEQCDSAAQFMNQTCDPNTCQLIPIVCGNGLPLQPGKQCDSAAAFANNTCAGPSGVTVDNVPPPGTHLIAPCQNIPAVCGDGLVEPGEQCDGGPTGSVNCSTSCIIITPCLICEQAGPSCLGTSVMTGGAFGCLGLTGATAQTNCQNLKTCLDDNPFCSNPADVSPATSDPTACFCGAMDAATCAGANPATATFGPCASAYFALYPGGATVANVGAILGDFFNRATATGMANNLYACDVTKGCVGTGAVCP